MKYIGVGTKKTGTTTLGRYFEACGIKRYVGGNVKLTHQVLKGDYTGLYDRLQRYDAFEDAPWFMVYQYLYETCPNARFILTVRSSPEKWLESTIKHCENYGLQYPFRQVYGHHSPKGHEDAYLAAYNAHNQAVEQFFADKPGRFIKICFEEDGAHQRLLAFLGVKDAEIPPVWSNAGTGGEKAGRVYTRSRACLVYFTRCMLERLNLPMR